MSDSRKLIQDARQVGSIEVGRPAAGRAGVFDHSLKRDGCRVTHRTEHRMFVPAFRFRFEKCPAVLDKLFRRRHSLILVFKLGNALSQFGIFLLKVRCALRHCFRLFLQEGGPFPQDGVKRQF